MIGRLSGKVAIITGATQGLGKVAALLFAEEGAAVVICDRGRTPEHAQEVLTVAEGLDGEIVHRICDVMKPKDIKDLVQFTLGRYGKVDVMVNNAVISNPAGLLEDVTLEDWEAGLFCHMTAPLLFCKEVVPAMVQQGGGSIINVSSSDALFGNPSISSYGPAKAGMINFTRSIAITYAPYGIRANALTPARMLTEKKYRMLENNPAEIRRQDIVYPLGSPALPEQVAEVMLFLATDASEAITGHNLVADRGLSAQNPTAVASRIEADLRERLAEQGSTWLQEEM